MRKLRHARVGSMRWRQLTDGRRNRRFAKQSDYLVNLEMRGVVRRRRWYDAQQKGYVARKRWDLRVRVTLPIRRRAVERLAAFQLV